MVVTKHRNDELIAYVSGSTRLVPDPSNVAPILGFVCKDQHWPPLVNGHWSIYWRNFSSNRKLCHDNVLSMRMICIKNECFLYAFRHQYRYFYGKFYRNNRFASMKSYLAIRILSLQAYWSEDWVGLGPISFG